MDLAIVRKYLARREPEIRRGSRVSPLDLLAILTVLKCEATAKDDIGGSVKIETLQRKALRAAKAAKQSASSLDQGDHAGEQTVHDLIKVALRNGRPGHALDRVGQQGYTRDAAAAGVKKDETPLDLIKVSFTKPQRW